MEEDSNHGEGDPPVKCPNCWHKFELAGIESHLGECSGLSPGMNCIKIGLPGKLILSKRKGLREVLFS